MDTQNIKVELNKLVNIKINLEIYHKDQKKNYETLSFGFKVIQNSENEPFVPKANLFEFFKETIIRETLLPLLAKNTQVVSMSISGTDNKQLFMPFRVINGLSDGLATDLSMMFSLWTKGQSDGNSKRFNLKGVSKVYQKPKLE